MPNVVTYEIRDGLTFFLLRPKWRRVRREFNDKADAETAFHGACMSPFARNIEIQYAAEEVKG